MEYLRMLMMELEEAESFKVFVGRFGHPEVTYRDACKHVAAIKRQIKEYKRVHNMGSQMSKDQAIELINSAGIDVVYQGDSTFKYILVWEYGDKRMSEIVKDGRALVNVAKHVDTWKEDRQCTLTENFADGFLM